MLRELQRSVELYLREERLRKLETRGKGIWKRYIYKKGGEEDRGEGERERGRK